MKILLKKDIFKEAEKIISNFSSQLNMWGYQFPERSGELFVPGYLFISWARNHGITTNKALREYLQKIFKTDNIIQKQYDYTFQVMAFEFEKHVFVVWFNATGKGSTIETTCLDNEVYHRFCLSLLHKLKYRINKERLEFAPDYVLKEVSKTGVLSNNFLNSFLSPKSFFNKKMERYL
jgi:hypothetical protein